MRTVSQDDQGRAEGSQAHSRETNPLRIAGSEARLNLALRLTAAVRD